MNAWRKTFQDLKNPAMIIKTSNKRCPCSNIKHKKIFVLLTFNPSKPVSQPTHVVTSPISSSLWMPVISKWFSPFKHNFFSFPVTSSSMIQNLIIIPVMIPHPSTYFHYPQLFITSASFMDIPVNPIFAICLLRIS